MGGAGAVVVVAVGTIMVPTEEEESEDELMVDTTAASVANESADAEHDVDELVDVFEVVDEVEEEVEDEESPVFLLALFFVCFFSLSMEFEVSLHDCLLLLPPEEVVASSFAFVASLEDSISLINCNNVTEKNGLTITTIPRQSENGEGCLDSGTI